MGDYGLCHRPVVDGIINVIRDSRRAAIDPQSRVDSDVLLVDPFIRVDPDNSRNNEVGDVNSVKLHGRTVGRWPSTESRFLIDWILRRAIDTMSTRVDSMPTPYGGPMPTNLSDPVIAVKNLRKTFGSVEAVKDVSFEVESGQVLGLLGPNGAGKTTTINMISTLTQIDAGEATVSGFDVQEQPEVVRQLIGLAGQSAAVDEKLTARENLELFGRLYKIPRAERRQRIGELIDRFDLSEFADRPASTYSGGERRRLDVVAALVAEPPAVFLDEPTTGLDPRSRSELWDTVRSLASSGVAIVLSTQYLEEADRLADKILVIDQGRIVAQGTPETLKRELERDVLEVQVASTVDLDIARDLIGSDLTIDVEALRIEIPVHDGASRSLDLLRKLQDNGVSISNFHLRQPTLDDVFLALTGSAAADSEGVTI